MSLITLESKTECYLLRGLCSLIRKIQDSIKGIDLFVDTFPICGDICLGASYSYLYEDELEKNKQVWIDLQYGT